MIGNTLFSKVLVPIDGSSKSIEALKYALKLANELNFKQITIIYVIDINNVKNISLREKSSYNSILNNFKDQGKNYINKTLISAQQSGLSTESVSSQIKEGDPVEKIVEVSKGYDLIIMSVRGKQRHVIQFLMGHVTERVINLSDIPVLVLP